MLPSRLHRLPFAHLSATLFATGVMLMARPSVAQQHMSVPRADGQSTPLMFYHAITANSGCAPLAVISHGAGGSENGYGYLAHAMARMGYTTVVMGHAESGLAAMSSSVLRRGIMPGVTALVADSNAEQARLLDVGAALQWADSKCRAPFRVLLGHSMGAATVMLEAGAKNIISVTSPPAGQDRFDAYVALSPDGSGIVFPDDAWSELHKPMLILTGTRDRSLKGGPEARLVPWSKLPGTASRCQWEGVIDGATHLNFAGVGLGHATVEPMVTQTIEAFLGGVIRHACTLPKPVSGLTLKAK